MTDVDSITYSNYLFPNEISDIDVLFLRSADEEIVGNDSSLLSSYSEHIVFNTDLFEKEKIFLNKKC
jgi:hypothetical protein